jgi:hypothetical protein
MKSKELIKQLQELDPTGEIEVGCGNHDIWYAERMPAYYDGRFQLLLRDPKLTGKCFDIIGARYVSRGDKIKLVSMGVADVLWDNPDAVVEYPFGEECYRKTDEATRQASRDVELKCDMDFFRAWVAKKTEQIRPGENSGGSADYHYKRLGLSPKDPVKDLPPRKEKLSPKDDKEYEVWPSWNERQEAMWDDTLEVYWKGGWGVRRKGDPEEHVA